MGTRCVRSGPQRSCCRLPAQAQASEGPKANEGHGGCPGGRRAVPPQAASASERAELCQAAAARRCPRCHAPVQRDWPRRDCCILLQPRVPAGLCGKRRLLGSLLFPPPSRTPPLQQWDSWDQDTVAASGKGLEPCPSPGSLLRFALALTSRTVLGAAPLLLSSRVIAAWLSVFQPAGTPQRPPYKAEGPCWELLRAAGPAAGWLERPLKSAALWLKRVYSYRSVPFNQAACDQAHSRYYFTFWVPVRHARSKRRQLPV